MRYAVPVLTTWLECRLATETLPLTFRLLKVPTLVILGCAAVANVPMSDVADTFPLALRFKIFKFPEMSSAPYETAPEEGFTKITFPVVAALNPVKLTPPATFREDNVPRVVRLELITGCLSAFDVKTLPPILYVPDVFTFPSTSRVCAGLSVLMPTIPSIGVIMEPSNTPAFVAPVDVVDEFSRVMESPEEGEAMTLHVSAVVEGGLPCLVRTRRKIVTLLTDMMSTAQWF
jgi:hypothetical protein